MARRSGQTKRAHALKADERRVNAGSSRPCRLNHGRLPHGSPSAAWPNRRKGSGSFDGESAGTKRGRPSLAGSARRSLSWTTPRTAPRPPIPRRMRRSGPARSRMSALAPNQSIDPAARRRSRHARLAGSLRRPHRSLKRHRPRHGPGLREPRRPRRPGCAARRSSRRGGARMQAGRRPSLGRADRRDRSGGRGGAGPRGGRGFRRYRRVGQQRGLGRVWPLSGRPARAPSTHDRD
jgi:hypothetical protein